MLSVHDLTRAYGDATVLDGVSFDVRPGRVTGFVGANGAGKTTTMRIVVGVLAATRGEVTWDGAPITVEQRRRIGYMPEERGLYPKMRVREQLAFFGRLHGQSREEAEQRAHELLARLGLEEREHDVLETLSLGNQQRVQIAAALMHRPDALVLDEPFSGLDPIAVDSMVSLLRDEVSAQVPVLFSSHQLELVENLCDDLVILSRGRVVAAGAVEDLRRREADRFRVVLAQGSDAGTLRDLPELTVLDAAGPEALVELREGPPEKVLEIIQRTAPVAEFARVVRPLAQVYREVVR
ncbi:MAG TPA: ATP-binding cassette domain-containing protein [Nocardioides sp.]|uniref:ABC transporter ATP-binding protein n=1 Tax=Nocardioides sp. TaxID=35761 RepID=UPI002D7F55F3|nr:ATP-binding cassette domain-containing protein [Nocardioides sp.]HET6651137.1 ATP-binding cassette domain-containing protein [Nocardioides sp.]